MDITEKSRWWTKAKLAAVWFGSGGHTWPGRAAGQEKADDPLAIAALNEISKGFLYRFGPASEGSGPLSCAAIMTDCDSTEPPKQVASESKGKFDDRALLCQGRSLFLAVLTWLSHVSTYHSIFG